MRMVYYIKCFLTRALPYKPMENTKIYEIQLYFVINNVFIILL